MLNNRQKHLQPPKVCKICKSKISKSKIGNKNPMFGIPNPNKGKIIINNNIKNLYIYPEELNIYIASGWKKGKVKK